MKALTTPRGCWLTPCSFFHRSVRRLVIVLRTDCDPRFLSAVPERWGFFGVHILPYVLPSFQGRRMIGTELAYSFGDPNPIVERQAHHSYNGPKAQPVVRYVGDEHPSRPVAGSHEVAREVVLDA